MEREKIEEEYSNLQKSIKWLKEVLGSEEKVLKIIKEELMDVRDKYADPRRTQIAEYEGDISMEDLIHEEEVVVAITNRGYVKRLPVDTFKMQRRGGKGVIGTDIKEEDFVEDLFIASTHDYLLCFTSNGQVHWLKVYKVPPASTRYSRGKAIVNLLNLKETEKVTAVIPIREFDDRHYLIMATRNGLVKKVVCSAFGRPRSTGIIAITITEGDELEGVKLTNGSNEVVLGTKYGKAIRFDEGDIRPTGRTSQGVIGIRLANGDEVVGAALVREESTLLAFTENGYGKRTEFPEYRRQKRGGTGIINISTSARNGMVVGVKELSDEDEIIIISSSGIMIREPVKAVPVQGRNTQGVKLMKLDKDDKVVAMARIIQD